MGIEVNIAVKDLETLKQIRKKTNRFYIAGAYSKTQDKDIVWSRHNTILGALSLWGYQAYSPIVHFHWVGEMVDKDLNQFILKHGFNMLEHWANVLLVYEDPEGQYEKSVGVQKELEYAAKLNLLVGHVTLYKNKNNIVYWKLNK